MGGGGGRRPLRHYKRDGCSLWHVLRLSAVKCGHFGSISAPHSVGWQHVALLGLCGDSCGALV